MSFLRRSIDVANSEIQFEVAENANSVNLKFNDEITDSQIGAMTVRVEKVTKNATDRVLYSGTMANLKSVLKFAFPNLKNLLPFSIGKSLILNDDDKLVITIGNLGSPASGEGVSLIPSTFPTSFEYEINKNVETTSNPLVIKKVAVDEELNFSTEFYPFCLIPKTVKSYETVVMVESQITKNVEPRKIFLGNALIVSQIQENHDFLTMVTSPNQDINIKGSSTVYLILA